MSLVLVAYTYFVHQAAHCILYGSRRQDRSGPKQKQPPNCKSNNGQLTFLSRAISPTRPVKENDLDNLHKVLQRIHQLKQTHHCVLPSVEPARRSDQIMTQPEQRQTTSFLTIYKSPGSAPEKKFCRLFHSLLSESHPW